MKKKKSKITVKYKRQVLNTLMNLRDKLSSKKGFTAYLTNGILDEESI